MKAWLARWYRYFTPWSLLSQDDILKTPRWYRYFLLRRNRHSKCPACGHRSGPKGEEQKMQWCAIVGPPLRLGLQRQCSMCSAVWMEQSIVDASVWNLLPPEQSDEVKRQQRYADREPKIVKLEPQQPERKVG